MIVGRGEEEEREEKRKEKRESKRTDKMTAGENRSRSRREIGECLE